MSQRMKLFIFLLIVNLIVIVIYLVWNHIRRKENLRSVWMKAVMMFLCPVVGPMFVLLSFILFKLFSSQGMDLSDIVFSKDRTENFLRPDEEMERNMVSLEEALEVTDKKSLRTLMLNVIRGDYQNSLSSINLALNSKDSETAHYAASILQDVLNNFRSQVQKKYLLCQEENEQQVENCVNLVEYMNPILEQKVLTDIEQKSMTDKMQEVLQKAWDLDKIRISSTVYEKVCQRLLEINRCAARYFYENLNAKTPEAAMARRYWKEKRGLSDAAIRRFGLGYAPEDFGGLLHYLKRRGFSEEELETSGLVKRSAKGNLYDIFRHRVMVPIIDVRGAIIAFGGRVLDDSKPKYINSPETMVYHKSRTLFALNIAKKSKNRRYILCEGYMDVISMHEAGFDTAVCACGTALTPEQAKLLSEYADEVVLSYDSDEAGQKATERSLGILGSTTLKVSVLSYQGAKDPDEFIKKYGRERFEMLLNGTANPTEFQLKKSKAKYDLRSDDGRLSYIREAIEILTERGVSPTARDVYAGRLADETGVSKQAILSQLNGALQAAARRSYRKEQRDLSKEGIASDIRVPYTSSGESALGAANAARQLAVAMLQDPEQVPYVRARLDMSTVLVPEMQRALEAIFRCVDEHLPLNQTSLQQMLDEAAFQQLAHGQAYNHDIRLQRQDIDMYLDRLQTAKPISEQVKGMSDGQLESYFANLGKKKGARPAETDE